MCQILRSDRLAMFQGPGHLMVAKDVLYRCRFQAGQLHRITCFLLFGVRGRGRGGSASTQAPWTLAAFGIVMNCTTRVNGRHLAMFTRRSLLTTALSESKFPLGDSRAHSIILIIFPLEQMVFENLLKEDPAFLERVLIAKTTIRGLEMSLLLSRDN